MSVIGRSLPFAGFDQGPRRCYIRLMSARCIRIIRGLLIALSGLAVLLFFYQSIRNHNYVNGNDLTSYLNSSRWFFEGDNPYTAPVRRFIYPLFLLLVTYPLSFLQGSYFQKALAAGIWSLLAWFAFFKTIFASWNSLYGPRNAIAWFREHLFSLALIVFLLHPFLQDEFLNGQVNLVMVGSLAGFYFALQRDRQFLAALFLSIATAIKVGPGICLLFVLITGQYRVIPYFIGLMFLWVIGLPYLVNDQSLTYYGYFIDTVIPHVAASDFEHGFKQYSLISTLSYAFDLHWPPLAKMGAVCLVAIGLAAPIVILGRKSRIPAAPRNGLTAFAAFMPVIPLTFPMSEAHHQLILLLPLIVIIDFWRERIDSFGAFFRDRYSLVFFTSLLLLHIGHGVKEVPLRFLGLAVLYAGMIALLRRRTLPDTPEK